MREKEYSEWLSKQGFNVLLHANCCKIAFNGGWESRQTEMDELKLQVAEMKSRLNDAYTDGQSAMYTSRQSKVDELQKRVDDLELTIKGAVTFVDLQIEATEQGREAAIGTQAKNWWSSKLLMLRPIRRVLEQALKGGEA